MPVRIAAPVLIGGVLALMIGAAAGAQDDDLHGWALKAARGAFDLCRADSPDAGEVAEHGEVWGWPRFVPYLEHPDGYRRDAGGESRQTDTVGDQTASVELGVQSGRVTSAAPANIRYFRCNVAADQPIEPDLAAYFSDIYGPPLLQSDQASVWLIGKGGAQVTAEDAASDDLALKPALAAGVGASVLRIELSRQRGLDRAKLTLFRNEAPG
jgi:hypothetical protein